MDQQLFEILHLWALDDGIAEHVCDHAKLTMLGGGGIEAAIRTLQPHFELQGETVPTVQELQVALAGN